MIHAAAFDLRGERGNSLDKVTESLALLYERVLLLASKVGRKTLRIPPISTGIYSGSLFSSMPQITATAFGRALQRQAADSNFKAFAERVERVEICLYDSSLVKAYEMSFDTLKTQVGESTPQRVRH